MTSGDCTSCPVGKVISGTGCTLSTKPTVVVLELIIDTTDEGVTTEDVKREIEGMLGIVVTVIEISKGVFEITTTDGTDAETLVNAINNICRK
jgi:hypothetical protein